jgi:hypothetical protein
MNLYLMNIIRIKNVVYQVGEQGKKILTIKTINRKW